MANVFKIEIEPSDASNSRRREARISINLLVEITRYDAAGSVFTERTRIEDVTSVGCRFRTETELQRGDTVSIRALVPGQKSLAGVQSQLFEIMWTAPQGTSSSAGARKLEGEKLANVKFPPANSASEHTPK